MTTRIAVYPGSFDPITNGHLDIIDRGLKLFDRIIVAVAINPAKTPLFSIDERVRMLQTLLSDRPGAEVDTFAGLLVHYAGLRQASSIIRGLRAVSDFEFEFQQAQMNRSINPCVETVFMMAAVPYTYLSSSIVKEVSSLNGSVEGLVPQLVLESLAAKFNR